MKLHFTRLVLAVLCCALLCSVAMASEPELSAIKTDCTVDASGSCSVVQTITLDLTEPVTELSFPLAENAKKGSLVGYSASSSVVDGVPVLTLKTPVGYSGMRTFTLRYTLDKLVTEADGVQTLTLPMLSPRWEWPISVYSFTVTMPAEFSAQPAFESGYYGDAIEDYILLQKQDLVLSGSMLQPLKDHESLKMTMELPAGYFSGAYAKWSAGWSATVLVVLLAIAAVVYWLLTLQSGPVHADARNVPPDSVLPGDIPFLLCGGKPDFNMLVCHWASLGYLVITSDREGVVTLHKRVEMGSERRRIEQKLFAMLFDGEDTCDGASLRYKKVAAKASVVIPRFWKRRILRRDGGNVRIMQLLSCLAMGVALLLSMSFLLPAMSGRWLVLAVCFVAGFLWSIPVQGGPRAFLLKNRIRLIAAAAAIVIALVLSRIGGGFLIMVLALLLSLFTGWQTMYGGKCTDAGNQIIGQTYGYRKTMRRISESRVRQMLKSDPQYFYRTLPYAEALGLGSAFAAKFRNTALESCSWYAEQTPLPRTAPEFYSRWKEAMALLDLSIRK